MRPVNVSISHNYTMISYFEMSNSSGPMLVPKAAIIVPPLTHNIYQSERARRSYFSNGSIACVFLHDPASLNHHESLHKKQLPKQDHVPDSQLFSRQT